MICVHRSLSKTDYKHFHNIKNIFNLYDGETSIFLKMTNKKSLFFASKI